jgi:hypothetical protein
MGLAVGAFKLPEPMRLSGLPPFDAIAIGRTTDGPLMEGVELYNFRLFWANKLVLHQKLWFNPDTDALTAAEDAKFLKNFMQANRDGWTELECLIRFFPRGSAQGMEA